MTLCSKNVSFVIIVAILTLFSVDVSGKNMQGKFGFGYEQTLLGVRGLTVQYWTSPKFAVDIVGGTGFELDKDNNSTTTLLFAGGFKYVMVATRYANLSVGIRADVGWRSKNIIATEADGATVLKEVGNVTQWGLEAPLEVEYFFSDSFSVNVITGLSFTMVSKDGAVLDPQGFGGVTTPEYKGVGIGGGSLFGGAGFRFYF